MAQLHNVKTLNTIFLWKCYSGVPVLVITLALFTWTESMGGTLKTKQKKLQLHQTTGCYEVREKKTFSYVVVMWRFKLLGFGKCGEWLCGLTLTWL